MRRDEVWMRLIEFEEAVLVFRKAEKIIFLTELFEWFSRMVRTDHDSIFLDEV